jgi:hypothetical protein
LRFYSSSKIYILSIFILYQVTLLYLPFKSYSKLDALGLEVWVRWCRTCLASARPWVQIPIQGGDYSNNQITTTSGEHLQHWLAMWQSLRILCHSLSGFSAVMSSSRSIVRNYFQALVFFYCIFNLLINSPWYLKVFWCFLFPESLLVS